MEKTYRIKTEEKPEQFQREFTPVEIEIPQQPQKIKVNLDMLKKKKAQLQEMITELETDIQEVENLLSLK